MSTAALPGSYAAIPPSVEDAIAASVGLPPVAKMGTSGRVVRRRGNLAQGQALEMLGHAVEYLMDCRMFAPEKGDPRNDQESIQILMRASCAVFAECPEVLPLRRRLQVWIGRGDVR